MRLLATLATVWGLVWFCFGLIGAGSLDAFTVGVPMLAVLGVGFVALATARSSAQLPRRLAFLWTVVVLVTFMQVAPGGSDAPWMVLAGAFLYGTMEFALWMGPPLVAVALIRQMSPATSRSSNADQR